MQFIDYIKYIKMWERNQNNMTEWKPRDLEIANIRHQWIILKTHEERKTYGIYFVFILSKLYLRKPNWCGMAPL